ncbi:MAG: hypothetical protein JRI95_03470 [Deltaproteobacteria bacterium]|nr:hypothetical protein [Deltaproteobacteria bacterium]MBW2085335.1 hypothetical protein [Deltaproteobacteria bacterium]
MSSSVDQKFIRQMQAKVRQELAEKERECVEYWQADLEKVLKRHHQDLAGLESDLKRILAKMNNRLKKLETAERDV